MRRLRRSYETINFNDIPELLTDEELKEVFKQRLPSAVYDVPASSQMASSYLTPVVQGNATSAPTPGEVNVNYPTTSSQRLPSIDVRFDLASQTTSTPRDGNSSYDLSPCLSSSAPPSSTATEDTILCYNLSSSDPFPDLQISASPSQAAPESTDISSAMTPSDSSTGIDITASSSPAAQGNNIISSPEFHISVPPTPSVLGDVQMGYQTTSSQPIQISYNTVNSVPSTSQAQSFDQLFCLLPSTSSYNVAPPAPDRANINNQMLFEQPSLPDNTVAPPAQGCPDINHQMSLEQLFLDPNNVTLAKQGCPDTNTQMSVQQLSPASCNVEQSASGCVTINNRMSFSKPSPVCNNFLPLALGCADANQGMSFRPLLPALPNVAPRCNNFSVQKNASLPPTTPRNSMNFGRENNLAPKRRCLSKTALVILNNWFDSHIDHPYPDKGTVEMLSSTCNVTATHIKKWCSNKRRRHRKQLETQMPTLPGAIDSKDSCVDAENL